MRSKAVKTLALALMLGGAGIGLAQQQPGQPVQPPAPPPGHPGAPPPGQPGQPPAQPRQPGMPPGGMPGKKKPPEKSKLEEMLAEALKNNPDIRVAAAKLAMAEAELNRSRILVTQEVVRLHNIMQAQEAEINRWTTECERLAREVKNNVVSHTVLEESRHQLEKAKGKLAELEAQIQGLLGKSAQAEYYQTIQEAKLLRQEAIGSRRARIAEAELERAHKVEGPLAERMRKALQRPIKVDYKEVNFADVLKDLEKKAPGLAIRNSIRGASFSKPGDLKVNLHFEEELPVSAVLQALGDEFEMRFFVRDYGIVVATQGFPLPPGALTIEEFLRQKPAAK